LIVPFGRSLRRETQIPPELASCAERVACVRLSGEVDGAETDRFASWLGAFAKGGPADLIVDLSRITFLSTAGADVLVALSEEFSRTGRRLVVILGFGQARRLLDALRVTDGLEIHATFDSAVSAYLNTAERGERARVARPVDEDTVVTSDLTSGLARLTGALLEARTVTGVLERTIVTARRLVPGADSVSVTVREPNGGHHTPVQTDDDAGVLDRLQYESGEGPCIDAADPAGPAYARSGTLHVEPSWPTFGPAAAGLGYNSVLSTALLTGPQPSSFAGALNIYSRSPGGFSAGARDTAFILATCASLALNTAYVGVRAEHGLNQAHQQAADLRRALETRTVIGQAIGILMARRGLNAVEAFNVLNRTSQDHNIKLVRLSERLAADPTITDRI
jgi:anti-anti-sigma factor